jgi:hypothetical protein
MEKGLISEQSGWNDFHTPPVQRPNDSHHSTPFEALKRIYADIINSAMNSGVLRTQDSLLAPLVIDEDRKSESEGSDTLGPDGYLYLENSALGYRNEGVLDHEDVVLFMGLEPSNEIADCKKASR